MRNELKQFYVFQDITILVVAAASGWDEDDVTRNVHLEPWHALTAPFDDGECPKSYYVVDPQLVPSLRQLDQKVDFVGGLPIWARREVGPIDEAFINAITRMHVFSREICRQGVTLN